MNACQVDAGLENIGVPGQRLSRQKTAIRQAPNAHSIRIHIGPCLQILATRDDVLILAVAGGSRIRGGTERPAFTLDDQFRVRGFGGCNSFSATAFPLKEQGIAVGPLAMTKRSCDPAVMATEQAFFNALRTSAKWDTIIGSLVIKGPNGEMKFERSL